MLMGTGGVMIRLPRARGSTAWRALSCSLLFFGSLAARAESALVLDVTSDDDVDPRLLESLTDKVRSATTSALVSRGLTMLDNGTIAAVFLRCGDDRCRREIARARDIRFIIQGRLRVLSNQARLQLVVSDGERVIAERSVAKPAAIDLLDVVAAAAGAVALEAYQAPPPLAPAPPPVQPPASADTPGNDSDVGPDSAAVKSTGATSAAPIEQPTWTYKGKQFPTKEGAISAARAERWDVISTLYYGGCLIAGLGAAMGGLALYEGRLFTQPSLSGVLGTIGIGACACGAGAAYDYGVVQGEVREAAAHAVSLPPERLARLTPAIGPTGARDDRNPDGPTGVPW